MNLYDQKMNNPSRGKFPFMGLLVLKAIWPKEVLDKVSNHILVTDALLTKSFGQVSKA